MISRTVEDYLKTIYQLTTSSDRVSTSRLASTMDCSAASVTSMLQKLSELKLVQYTPYRGVVLTRAGSKIALEIIRHHRLIELYLSEVLGFSWDRVHDEAERLEHVISEEFEEKIDQVLGYPTKDPHGDPIPTRDGEINAEVSRPLWEIPIGKSVKVHRVSDRNSEVLRYLASVGIYPNVTVSIKKRSPFNGPIQIEMGDKEQSLSKELARQIYVIST